MWQGWAHEAQVTSWGGEWQKHRGTAGTDLTLHVFLKIPATYGTSGPFLYSFTQNQMSAKGD